VVEINYTQLQVRLAETTSTFVNGCAPDLPPLYWISRDTELIAQVPEAEYADPESVAQQWRAALSLNDCEDSDHGTRTFAGTWKSRRVEVWYVTDRAKFEYRIQRSAS